MTVIDALDWIDFAVKILQGVFFIAIPTIAYYTYQAAKDQLKNPINTEFKKIVFERLHKLSNELHHYISEETRVNYEKDFEEYVHNLLRFWRAGGEGNPEFDPDNLEEIKWLKKFIIDLESNPFIPKPMREDLYLYYSQLYAKRRIAFRSSINQYFKELTPRTGEGDADRHFFEIESRISQELSETPYGYLSLRQTTIDFRLRIEEYFDQFETLEKKNG